MAFRLILVMAMGLGAMYMLHLLAQDWNRIRRPVTRALTSAVFRSKRELSGEVLDRSMEVNNETADIDWNAILLHDPLECLQSLICQIMSGAESNTEEAVLLKDFVQATLAKAPKKIQRALSRGLTHHAAPDHCFSEYPFCLYSAKIMFKMLRWFSRFTVPNTAINT